MSSINNPICDIDPEHGPMESEPMYGLNNVINQYGWFCQVQDCDGYGGPVKNKRASKPKDTNQTEQLSLFEEQE